MTDIAAGPSERDKMLAGMLYDANDPELMSCRAAARRLCNALAALDPADSNGSSALLRQLFGYETNATVLAPLHCDYGFNILLGSSVYINVNCVLLDVLPVRIGSNTLIGPGCHIYTASHPMNSVARRAGLESGLPVTIEEDVWIGGGAIICPGVVVGAGSVIGAGSVVTRSVPGRVFAAGNPCRVVRALEPEGGAQQ
ncbi:MAG: sugar O-acetyltransferase [Caldimonas sp.]